jgi:hypothetical protein
VGQNSSGARRRVSPKLAFFHPSVRHGESSIGDSRLRGPHVRESPLYAFGHLTQFGTHGGTRLAQKRPLAPCRPWGKKSVREASSDSELMYTNRVYEANRSGGRKQENFRPERWWPRLGIDRARLTEGVHRDGRKMAEGVL